TGRRTRVRCPPPGPARRRRGRWLPPVRSTSCLTRPGRTAQLVPFARGERRAAAGTCGSCELPCRLECPALTVRLERHRRLTVDRQHLCVPHERSDHVLQPLLPRLRCQPVATSDRP